MTANLRASDGTKRRLRLGMVGGGPGAFIGSVHRLAARMDDHFELVAAALTSDPERSRAAALDLHIPPERAYGSFASHQLTPTCSLLHAVVPPDVAAARCSAELPR